jgi:hypothetical protein
MSIEIAEKNPQKQSESNNFVIYTECKIKEVLILYLGCRDHVLHPHITQQDVNKILKRYKYLKPHVQIVKMSPDIELSGYE